MKKILQVALCVVGVAAAAMSVDSTGILASRHDLVTDANSVRVELVNFNEMRVFSTGERRNNTGELNKISAALEGVNEFEINTWTVAFDILNTTKGIGGNSGYIDISVGDQLELYDGNRTTDGIRPLKPNPWINARRGSRITLNITTRELDCTRQRVCGRGNTGSIVYEMTIPPVPSNLPSTCGPENSFRGRMIGGMFQFEGMLDYSRVVSGSPIIEPTAFETDSFLCILPVED